MDTDDINLIRYIWIRRLNSAWKTCANRDNLNPAKILCAL